MVIVYGWGGMYVVVLVSGVVVCFKGLTYLCVFFFQAEDGIRDLVRSRGLGDVYKRQVLTKAPSTCCMTSRAAKTGPRHSPG